MKTKTYTNTFKKFSFSIKKNDNYLIFSGGITRRGKKVLLTKKQKDGRFKYYEIRGGKKIKISSFGFDIDFRNEPETCFAYLLAINYA